MKVFTNDSKELSRIFRNDEGAVMCQGAAYYLHLKYLEAGYRSYLVGFKSDVFSHAMALVEVERKDRQRALIVQDPSFNLSYVDSVGQPLSILEIMTELAQDPVAAGQHFFDGLLAKSVLYAAFDRPIYVYRRYPMDAKGKADADQVFNSLVGHYPRIRAK